MEMRKRRPQPEFIRVYDQAGGINFYILRKILWEENPIVKEYLARTTVRVVDVRNQLNKCKEAWEDERGIFFE